MVIWDYDLVMTKRRVARIVPAAEFKAKCLALLDDVAERGSTVIVTKRGRPVARVVPLDDSRAKGLVGSVLDEGDIVSPIGEEWDAER